MTLSVAVDAPVYEPPDDLLSEDDLRAWLEAILPALHAAGCSRYGLDGDVDPRAAQVKFTRADERRVMSEAGGYVVRVPRRRELRLRVAAPSWVAARTLELRLDSDGGCRFLQSGGQWKSALDVMDWLSRRYPRWRVPPQGSLPYAVYLREKNGWEGECWRYYLPISAEPTLRELAGAQRSFPGRDMRTTPFDPPSLASFGSWAVELGYLPEWRARYLCETSRCGYMPYHNWAGGEEEALARLLAQARELDLLRPPADSSDGGVEMYKAQVRLCAPQEGEEPRQTLAEVRLA